MGICRIGEFSWNVEFPCNSYKSLELYKINQYINYDYDVLYIGAWIRNNKYNFITEDLIKVNYTCCLHAYIVRNHYYDTLLNNLNKGLNLKIQYPNNYKYNNDEYIKSIARTKFHLVSPGEKIYKVIERKNIKSK